MLIAFKPRTTIIRSKVLNRENSFRNLEQNRQMHRPDRTPISLQARLALRKVSLTLTTTLTPALTLNLTRTHFLSYFSHRYCCFAKRCLVGPVSLPRNVPTKEGSDLWLNTVGRKRDLVVTRSFREVDDPCGRVLSLWGNVICLWNEILDFGF